MQEIERLVDLLGNYNPFILIIILIFLLIYRGDISFRYTTKKNKK